MIKLLATDLDGTLLYPKRKLTVLTKKNKRFLRNFVKNGNRLILVSGRNYHICKTISKVVKKPIDMVACNGSVVFKDNQFLCDNPLSKEDIKLFLKDNFNAANVVAWVFMSNNYPMVLVPVNISCVKLAIVKLWMLSQLYYRDKTVFGRNHLDTILADPNIKIYKMMAMYGVGKEKIEIARQESLKFIDAWDTKFEILWSRESVEFMKKGVNKANALEKLIQLHKINPDEVAVIGDSGNDVPLFEKFDHSFVMSNAAEEVKKQAKIEIKGVYDVEQFIN